MSKLKQIQAILRSIDQHPLAGRHRLKAYYKFLQWQIGGMLNPGPKKISFTERSYLLASKGMAGATGNIYMGLHEFADMGFLLHFLRKGDLFFDIGANIGSYTVLASGHVGAKTFAFEPVPSTFRSLENNIRVNGINHLVKAFNVGVGSKKGQLIFTASNDTVNHVVPGIQSDYPGDTVEVQMVVTDDITREYEAPGMIKIDVEGFETEVILGMKSTLGNEKLKAVIIELNGSGGRYGYEENAIRMQLADAGFKPYEYDPFTRKLNLLESYGHFNTLYLRDMVFVEDRVSKAEKVFIFSEKF